MPTAVLFLFQIPVNHFLSINYSYNMKVNKNKSAININNNEQKRGEVVQRGETLIDFYVTVTGWFKIGLMS